MFIAVRTWTWLAGLICLCLMAMSPSRADVARLADGSTVNFKQVGKGSRTVILLHGWSFDHRMWDKIGAHFPADYRLIAYDLRGFGESSKPASGYDYASFVKIWQADGQPRHSPGRHLWPFAGRADRSGFRSNSPGPG